MQYEPSTAFTSSDPSTAASTNQFFERTYSYDNNPDAVVFRMDAMDREDLCRVLGLNGLTLLVGGILLTMDGGSFTTSPPAS